MKTTIRNFAATACAATSLLLSAHGAVAQELDDLYDALRNANPDTYEQIENKIWDEWSKSGSASMDLLLNRARTALGAGDFSRAVEHATALIDHAPDFAEGYNTRATAYFQQGKFGLSIADIRRTLELNPQHFGAIGGLAMILEELGYAEDALDAYRTVKEMSPHREGIDAAILRLERQVLGSTL